MRQDHSIHYRTGICLYRYDGTPCLDVADGNPVSLASRPSVMTLVEAVRAIVLDR